MTVVGRLAIVGERVRIPRPGSLRQEPVERLRMSQLVLGQRAHRDVLFEQRRDAGPLRVGKPDDELVVGHRAEELVEAVDVRQGNGDRRGHPSGRYHGSERSEVGGGAPRRHPPEDAFGLAWPAAARAAASLSRIT